MTREQKTGLAQSTAKIRRTDRETREVRTAYWGASALVLAYLTFLCAVKGHAFTLVGIGAAAVLLGALTAKIASYFAD